MTEDELAHYFRHGWVHLKGVLPPQLVTELREVLRRSGTPLWPWSINGYMMYDELLDFYLFSPLGHIASQVFGGEPAVLWSDFRYWRESGQMVSRWHYDGGECEHILLLANDTARARVRTWVSLDDAAPGPVMASQTLWNDVALPGTTAEAFWAGRGADNGMTGDATFSAVAGNMNSSHLRHFVEPVVRLGDIIVHSPCLFHQSPKMTEPRLVGFLCPTYQPPQSRYFTCGGCSPEKAARNCKHNLNVGDVIGTRQPCYPQAYPPPEHMMGKDVDFRYASTMAGDGSSLHWYLGFVGRRLIDMGTWDGWQEFAFAPSQACARPVAWLTNGVASLLGTLAYVTPGVYIG